MISDEAIEKLKRGQFVHIFYIRAEVVGFDELGVLHVKFDPFRKPSVSEDSDVALGERIPEPPLSIGDEGTREGHRGTWRIAAVDGDEIWIKSDEFSGMSGSSDVLGPNGKKYFTRTKIAGAS